MEEDLVRAWKRSVVRVWAGDSTDRRHIGTAFLISPTHLLTANHVVRVGSGELRTDLTLTGSPWTGLRKVVSCKPHPNDNVDIAVLSISEDGKAELEAVPSWPPQALDLKNGATVTIVGYSTADKDIETPKLTVQSYDGQANALVLAPSIATGLSGGPALQYGQLIGVVWARNADQQKTYCTPFRAFRNFALEVLNLEEHPPGTSNTGKSGPSSHGVDPADLAKILAEASAENIVSDIIRGRWSHSDLRALAQTQDLASEAVKCLASVRIHSSDTWRRMLMMTLLDMMPDVVDLIFEIIQNSSDWGERTSVLPAFRFVRSSRRTTAANMLRELGKSSDFDDKRLAIGALGFLGELSAANWIGEAAGVGKNRYADEKLAEYLAFAALNTYIHHNEVSRYETPLLSLERMVDLLNERNRQIHPFDFQSRLSVVRPGLTPALMKLGMKSNHRELLLGLLYAIDVNPSPFLASDLSSIGSDSKNESMVRWQALATLARIRSASATQLLEEGASLGSDYFGSMLLLSIGVNKRVDKADYVIDALRRQAGQVPHMHAAEREYFAIWAAGEIGSNNLELFVNELEGAKRSPISLCRGHAWISLAKLGQPISSRELQDALDHSTDFVERVLLGIAGLFSGHPDVAEAGIHATQRNDAPIWRLYGFTYNDFRRGLFDKLGEPGKFMLSILDHGDLG